MIKKFEEYLSNGTARKITPDTERAKNLIKDSDRKLKVLEKQTKAFGFDKDMLNEYILVCYDALMLLIRAKMLLDGYNASGFGAHEAEVSYTRILGFEEKNIQFLDQLRYFRNGMLYYGTILDKEYTIKVIEFTKESYKKLKNMIK